MASAEIQVLVAGHVCLDVIPIIDPGGAGAGAQLTPGSLIEISSTTISTGGAVPNTGLALHRLGVPVRLCGKVGNDLFGRAILQIINGHDSSLADGIVTDPDVSSSYTLVLSPPGADRLFLHYPGANATFVAADVPLDDFAGAKLFHFGYPPAMRSMYLNDGGELEHLFAKAAGQGMITSLDMCMPDFESEAGRTDWRRVLRAVLPHVDLFLPSLEEILFMVQGHLDATGNLDGSLCADLTDELLAMGTAVAGLKLGEDGIYLRTAPDPARFSRLAAAIAASPSSWIGRELHSPSFNVELAGTTGCGDCAIAGFIAAMLKGLTIETALTSAAAVGACCAETADALSGVRPWDATERRIESGWTRRPVPTTWTGWTLNDSTGLSHGPNDACSR